MSGSWSTAYPGQPLSQVLKGSRANEGGQEPPASETTVFMEAWDKYAETMDFYPTICIFLS